MLVSARWCLLVPVMFFCCRRCLRVGVLFLSQTVPGKSTSGSADFLKGEAGKRGEESNSREAEGQPILGSRRERETLISPVPRTGVDTPGQGTEAEGSILPPPGLEMKGQG